MDYMGEEWRKDAKSAEAFWTVPVGTFSRAGLEKERECPQANMVSLLVDFGSFGLFLSPCCDESFLEAVGPPRSWSNKDFPQQIQKHQGMKTMETKRRHRGFPQVNLMDILTLAFWQSLDGLYWMSFLCVPLQPLHIYIYIFLRLLAFLHWLFSEVASQSLAKRQW